MYCVDCGSKMVITDNDDLASLFFCGECSGWAYIDKRKIRNKGKDKNIVWASNTGKSLSDFIDVEKYYLNINGLPKEE